MNARSFTLISLLALPLLLTACGDGWEMIRTDTMFPYGNQRTAGSGVAYVRVKMMPERALNLKPEEPAPAVQSPPAEMLLENKGAMEKLFEQKQTK